jgi:hypothetical protein
MRGLCWVLHRRRLSGWTSSAAAVALAPAVAAISPPLATTSPPLATSSPPLATTSPPPVAISPGPLFSTRSAVPGSACATALPLKIVLITYFTIKNYEADPELLSCGSLTGFFCKKKSRYPQHTFDANLHKIERTENLWLETANDFSKLYLQRLQNSLNIQIKSNLRNFISSIKK